MASKIEWTNETWNPIAGCSFASPGCKNCYAMRRVAPRLAANLKTPHYHGTVEKTKAGYVWTGKIGVASDDVLTKPLRWRQGRMIFVNSTSDLFHEDVPDEVIDRVFAVMALCPQHTFQVLTKRPDRMRAYFSDLRGRAEAIGWAEHAICGEGVSTAEGAYQGPAHRRLPLSNVWLGTSVEDQKRADERVDDLRATPAAIRFLSCEPLIGPIGDIDLSGIHQVIVGGEGGQGSRPMHPAWARSLRDQCAAADVPFFFKQWGEFAPVCEMPEELIESCYHPAPEHSPEATKRCKVDQCVLHYDGERFNGRAMYERPAFEQGSGAMTMMAVGKKKAGRLLDGKLHDGMPA